MTHLVLISGRGNDDHQWALVGHVSGFTAAWNMDATTSVLKESSGYCPSDVVVLKFWRCNSSTWWPLNEGFAAAKVQNSQRNLWHLVWVLWSERQSQEWLVCTATNAQLKWGSQWQYFCYKKMQQTQETRWRGTPLLPLPQWEAKGQPKSVWSKYSSSCVTLASRSDSFISNLDLNKIVPGQFKEEQKVFKETKGGHFRGCFFFFF